jgi:hypothetical protein
MTDPERLKPLLPSARVALAAMIDSGMGDAAKLVAESGFSWNLSYALARAINGEGPATAVYFWNEGIPAAAAKAIADAIAEIRRAREAAAVSIPQPTNSGAQRGARRHPTYRYAGEI